MSELKKDGIRAAMSEQVEKDTLKKMAQQAGTDNEQTTLEPKPKIDFSCRVCGVICDSAPDPPARVVCPNCCEDHDYRYERELRGHYCRHCGEEAPEDWYDD